MRIQADLQAKEAKRLAYMSSFWNASKEANVNVVTKYKWPDQRDPIKQLRNTGRSIAYSSGHIRYGQAGAAHTLRSKSSSHLQDL